MQRLFDRWVKQMMHRDLRRSFRRICWVGPAPALPDDRPVVLYANHHHFHDGYLLWLVIRDLLGRQAITWMEEWDRFPFFGAAGAYPFPPDDARRRMATMRRTAHRLRDEPGTALFYFPEGELHAPETGIHPFAEGAFARLDRLFPEKYWWPVAIHVTFRGEALPTALLTGGTLHPAADGEEHLRLETLWKSLRSGEPEMEQVLLEGQHSPHETWDFSFAQRFFARYL